MTRLDIFVSSTMTELKDERATLFELLPTLGQGTIQLRPWVYEHSVKATDKVSGHTSFMSALQDSALCIVLLWNELGKGTLEEFEQAVEWDIPIHIYVKDEGKKSKKMQRFLKKWAHAYTGSHTSYYFKTQEQLKKAVTRSTQNWMREFLKNRRTEERAIITDDFDDITLNLEPMIGQDQLIASIMNKLRAVGEDDGANRLLIHGFGGVGKTALAMTIAQRWIKEYEKPIIWYVIGSSDADELYEGLLRGLNLDHQKRNEVLNKTGQDRRNSVREALNVLDTRPNLVILDNAWNNQGLTGLKNVIPSDIPVLVTSRSHFNFGETISLEEMTEESAVTLLSKHAGADYEDDNGAKDLCKYLDYLPFSIRIAGMNLKRITQLSPAAYLERIRKSPVVDRIADSEDRQLSKEDTAVYDSDPDFWDRTSMQQLLYASYIDLLPKLRQVFRASGVFSIPEVTSELLATYLKLPVEDIVGQLETLQVRGLIEPISIKGNHTQRYRLHNLSFSFLKNHYHERKSLEHIQNDSINACISYMETYHLDANAVDDEVDNLLGAAQLALQKEEDKKLVRLVELFTAFNGYIETRGHSTRTRRLLQQAFDDAGGLNTSRLLDEAYKRAVKAKNFTAASLLGGRRGEAFYRNGNFEEAIKQLDSALAYAKKVRDKYMEARILRLLGLSQIAITPPDRNYKKNLDEALDLAKKNNYPVVVMKVHEAWGHYYANQSQDYALAAEELQAAIDICEDLKDNITLFYLTLSLGGLKYKQAKLDDAKKLYEQAKIIAEATNSKPFLGYVHEGFWEIADMRGKRDLAQDYLSKSLSYYLQGELLDYLMQLSTRAINKKYLIAPQQIINILEFIGSRDATQLVADEKKTRLKELACAALSLYKKLDTSDDLEILSAHLNEIGIACN